MEDMVCNNACKLASASCYLVKPHNPHNLKIKI